MFTIDASVWVNGFDQNEVGHAISRQFLQEVGQRAIAVTVPTLVLAEVSAAIGRTRRAPQQAQAFVKAMLKLPNLTFIPLDIPLAEQASQLASQNGLRGADAVYAAVALQTGHTLISLDKEHLTRLKTIIDVQPPADALIGLTSSAS